MMMKAIIAITTICASFYAIYSIRQTYQQTPILRQLNATLFSQFNKFKTSFNKKYSSSEEEAHRFQIFSDTFQQIEAVNNANKPYKLRLYDYADLTEQEFKEKYLKKSEKVEFIQPTETIQSTVSDGEIDWQAEGYMARVKDQGTCGSCWSFGAIGAAEMLFNKRDGKKYPNLIELSEQQLVDCCHTDDTNGCNGGQPKDAMTCLTKGIGKEIDYPYFALENQCKAPSTVFTTTGYGMIDKGNNDQLLERLKMQALDIGVNAAPLAFRFFSSGVITEGCTWTEIDHDVVMVGAVTVDGKASWKIKNSWGPNWGKDGYLYVLRETGIKPALCAVNMKAYYPTL